MNQAVSAPPPAFGRLAGRAAYWLAPPLFCLALYWHGLNSWFRDDDFVWLRLSDQVRSWHDLLKLLFTPTDHGTFRPLSERAYFLVFGSLSRFDALPFRICAFLTQFANLALVYSITRRLTGSRLAGWLAPMLWVANSNLATALSWTSAYMQILCGFFLLLAFHFLLRWVETGRRCYYWLQWAVFLAGFLAMETNLVYPALAAGYTLVYSRKHFRGTLPLFAASLGFLVFHTVAAPKQVSGPYALHFDAALMNALPLYWRWALEPRNLSELAGYPGWVAPAGAALFSVALLGFTLWAARRRNWLPLMFLAWFIILLGPVLPLRDHRSAYYLTLPTIGLAMLAAYALATAWRAGAVWKSIAAALAAVFLLISVPGAWVAGRWSYQRSQEVKGLVLGVVRARELHPRRVILLTGVPDKLFWSAVWDGAFETMGVSNVYLDPDSVARVRPEAGRADFSGFVLPAELAAHGLRREELVVYEAGGPRLRNITSLYADRLEVMPGAAPRRVDVSNPLAEHLLGPAWYPLGGNHRWMPQRATVRLAGPRSAADRLYVTGYCPASHLGKGPVEMTLSVEGEPLPTVRIVQGDRHFNFDFALPAKLAGRPSVEVEIAVNRTYRPPGDPRELGLAFGVFEMR